MTSFVLISTKTYFSIPRTTSFVPLRSLELNDLFISIFKKWTTLFWSHVRVVVAVCELVYLYKSLRSGGLIETGLNTSPLHNAVIHHRTLISNAIML